MQRVEHHEPALMWIYGIFSACQVRYGRRFLAQYEGVALELVHRDWARVLRDYAKQPAAVQYALANLPEQPLLAPQFKALCAAAPQPATKLLPVPMATPARVREIRQQLQEIVHNRLPRDGKAWARDVLAKIERGEYVSYAAKRNAMAALGLEVRA